MWWTGCRCCALLQILEMLIHNPVIAGARAWDTPGADAQGLVVRTAIREHAAVRLAKSTLAAATEGANAAATHAAQHAAAAVEEAAAASHAQGGTEVIEIDGEEWYDSSALRRRRLAASAAALVAATLTDDIAGNGTRQPLAGMRDAGDGYEDVQEEEDPGREEFAFEIKASHVR